MPHRIPGETKRCPVRLVFEVPLDRGGIEDEGRDVLSKDDLAEFKWLRAVVAELRMECDVLTRSVVLWVKEARRRGGEEVSVARGGADGAGRVASTTPPRPSRRTDATATTTTTPDQDSA